MMSYQPGDIVLIAFPYTGGAQSRTRPALVILDTGDADVLVARITTQLHPTPHDVTIVDWRGAGPLAPSVARLHKLATLEKALIHRRLGTLPQVERQSVAGLLRQIYGAW